MEIKNFIKYCIKKDTCFMTGSYAFGYRFNTDIDYCMYMRDFIVLKEKLEKNHIDFKNSMYNDGIYFNINNEKINVIPFNTYSYKHWKMTTKIIKFFIKINPKFKEVMKNKNTRVSIFMIILGIIKSLNII